MTSQLKTDIDKMRTLYGLASILKLSEFEIPQVKKLFKIIQKFYKFKRSIIYHYKENLKKLKKNSLTNKFIYFT